VCVNTPVMSDGVRHHARLPAVRVQLPGPLPVPHLLVCERESE